MPAFGCCLKTFCIEIKLFFCICRDCHRDKTEHHALITGCQIGKEFLCLGSLEFHIVGDNGRKVVILILLALPVRDIGFNTEKSVFNLADCFISRNRENINREHEVLIHVCEFRNCVIADIVAIVLKE